MDKTRGRILPEELYRLIGTAAAPVVIDVRRREDFNADDAQIVGAIRRLPDHIDQWRHEIPKGRRVIVYCARGEQVSQDVTAALATTGADADYIEGGIAAWRERALPTRRRVGPAPSKWVTRERPTIDRIACPWLVSRFIDPEAEFIYVPAATVMETAKRTGAIPYDVANVEFGHHGEFCSFDAFIRNYGIVDSALDRLALIVRGADTTCPELTPQSAGLLAISQGLKLNFTDDHAMLAQGMVVYDAIYAWCRMTTQQRSPP
ncbi:MAG TPA: chromate resistance protein ChrB domain-containing protein [Stellaceae bacterium]|nr:chromate resistance protein ChrB domain-containing protein [Stellaceae bacterium]